MSKEQPSSDQLFDMGSTNGGETPVKDFSEADFSDVSSFPSSDIAHQQQAEGNRERFGKGPMNEAVADLGRKAFNGAKAAEAQPPSRGTSPAKPRSKRKGRPLRPKELARVDVRSEAYRRKPNPQGYSDDEAFK